MGKHIYTPDPVDLRAVGKVKIYDKGCETMHPNDPDGYRWEPVYDLDGVKVVEWWHSGSKHLADIADFERNKYGIRTKPQHYPICIGKNIRIFAPFTSDYPNLPEFD